MDDLTMFKTVLKAAAALVVSLPCAIILSASAHAANCDPKELLIKNFNYDRMDLATALAYKNASSEEWSKDTSKTMAGTFGYGAYSGGFNKDSATRVERLIKQETSLDTSLQLNSVTASSYLSREGLEAYKSCLGAEPISISLEDAASQDPIHSRQFTLILEYKGQANPQPDVKFALYLTNGAAIITGPDGSTLKPNADGKTYVFKMHINDKLRVTVVGRKRQEMTQITLNGVGYGISAPTITIPAAAPVVSFPVAPVEGDFAKVRTVGQCVGDCNRNIPPVPEAKSCVKSARGALIDGTEYFDAEENHGNYQHITETKETILAGTEVCFTLKSNPAEYAVRQGRTRAYEFAKPIVTAVNDPIYQP